MKNNIADKYFQQKSWSFLEGVCVVAIVIAVIVATVVTGGIPIGIPIIAVAAVTLIFIKSSTKPIKKKPVVQININSKSRL